jgi:hypothetical protein
VAAFAAMMGQRTGKEQLSPWMDAVETDDLPALHCLVASLRRDLAAVTNGLSLDYNSGQVEGTVNRIRAPPDRGFPGTRDTGAPRALRRGGPRRRTAREGQAVGGRGRRRTAA